MLCCTLLEKKEEINEAFFRQIEETLYFQTPILIGDFNHSPVRITTNMKVRDSLGCSGDRIQRILRVEYKAKYWIASLDLWRAAFGLFRD